MVSLQINVEKGKAGTSSRGAAYVSKSDIRVIASDIRYIKTSGQKLRDMTNRFDKGNVYILLLLLPFVYSGAFLIYRRHSIRLRTDAEYVRNRKARKQADKWLQDAKNLIETGKGFDDALHRSVSGFVADKANLPSGSLTTTDIVSSLEKRSFKEPQIVKDVLALLEECDLNRFASLSSTASDRQLRYNRAADIVVKLSREL